MWIPAVVLAGVLLWMVHAGGPKFDVKSVMGNLLKKQDLLARIRVDLFRAAETEKSAVMADTDEASREFAEQSRSALDSMDKAHAELGLLIQADPSPDETRFYKEFDTCKTELHKIDLEILDYAVMNTNLKAAALSFGKGTDIVRRLERILNTVPTNGLGEQDKIRAGKIIGEASASAYRLLSLQAPHIAASSDKRMSDLEAEMAESLTTLRTGLDALAALLPEHGGTALEEARKDAAELDAVNTQIVELSRRNSNVKSFELSLGRKRKILAQCDEILGRLDEAVHGRVFRATR